ncbi:MAG: isocitrate lyase/PEP mutase family protein, partial [bacterium]
RNEILVDIGYHYITTYLVSGGLLMKRSSELRKAIMERRALVVPGCHDALSAKIIESCGFEAIQVSGFGLAGSLMAKPDVGLVQMKDILDMTYNIVQAVSIPVMADIDTGGGNAINAMWITERLINMGCAGMNIEDQFFPKRCGHMAGKEVIDADEMVGKVRACAVVRDKLDIDFIINARTDSYSIHGLDEAIRRCNLYLSAGADLVFIDGIKTKIEIEKAIKEVRGPLSVNLMDAITGVKTELIPIPELAKMGVGRVSIPVASIMVAHKALTDFFSALKASTTGLLSGETRWITSFKDFTDFVGFGEYRELENLYLPEDRIEKKYKK